MTYADDERRWTAWCPRTEVMPVAFDLFDIPAERVDFALVRNFVLELEEANALTESLVVELKAARSGHNIVDAVAALANTDGGVVLVGVSESKRGDKRFIGVSAKEHDAVVNQLRSLLPGDAMPEVVPVALPEDESSSWCFASKIDGTRGPSRWRGLGRGWPKVTANTERRRVTQPAAPRQS